MKDRPTNKPSETTTGRQSIPVSGTGYQVSERKETTGLRLFPIGTVMRNPNDGDGKPWRLVRLRGVAGCMMCRRFMPKGRAAWFRRVGGTRSYVGQACCQSHVTGEL